MRIVRLGSVILLLAGVTGGASDFVTEGVDNARTGWVRDEKIFTKANVGSMKLLWKVNLESAPRAMHNLFAPLVAERVTTAQGARELAVAAGVSDDLFGLDVATGRQIWHRRFDSTLAKPGGTNDTLCPGGQTAVPTMAQTSPGKYTVYAVSWDGRLRQINLADGQDIAPPEKFIPGGGKPYALNLHNGVIYTATAQGCGGLTNAFYSFDLATRRASAFIPAGGGLWGRRGAAIDPEGRVFLGTGDAAFDPATRRLGNGIVGVKLDANKQLQLADFFGAPNANWLWRRDLDVNTTPVVIDYRARKFLVGTSKECRLWLLDREGLGGEDHRTSLYTTPLICNDAQAFDAKGIWGALSAWQDEQGAPVGARAILGTRQHDVQGADRARTAGRRRRRGVQARRARRQVAAHARLAFARHGSGGGDGDCQRRGVRLCGRRGCVAGDARSRLERAGRTRLRRRAQLRPRAPGAELAPRRALRARRSDREGTVVERQPDRIVESLQRAHRRERPRVCGHVRRRPLLLRRRQVGGGWSCAVNV